MITTRSRRNSNRPENQFTRTGNRDEQSRYRDLEERPYREQESGRRRQDSYERGYRAGYQEALNAGNVSDDLEDIYDSDEDQFNEDRRYSREEDRGPFMKNDRQWANPGYRSVPTGNQWKDERGWDDYARWESPDQSPGSHTRRRSGFGGRKK